MKYIKSFTIPGILRESKVMMGEKRPAITTVYPYGIYKLPDDYEFIFSDVTIFYGSNGCGKSTLVNVISEKTNAIRHSEFSKSDYFGKYCSDCYMKGVAPNEVQTLSSDDVFDYVMNLRYLNGDIDDHREQLIKGYASLKRKGLQDDDCHILHGLDDYDRWLEQHEVSSKKSSLNSFVKARLSRNIDMFSNGQTAMKYFTDHIDRDALYLLDEPENSLSIDNQILLKEFIEGSARYYGCQFIISTHSPILLSIDKAKIYNLDNKPFTIENWTELENVRKYYEFFLSHKQEFEKNI